MSIKTLRLTGPLARCLPVRKQLLSYSVTTRSAMNVPIPPPCSGPEPEAGIEPVEEVKLETGHRFPEGSFRSACRDAGIGRGPVVVPCASS